VPLPATFETVPLEDVLCQGNPEGDAVEKGVNLFGKLYDGLMAEFFGWEADTKDGAFEASTLGHIFEALGF
jgi:hypothetical protein